MIDPKIIREKLDDVRESLKKRGMEMDLHQLSVIDEKRRDLIKQVEGFKSDRNRTSDEIAQLKKAGQEATEKIERLRALGKTIEALEKDLKIAEKEWEDSLLVIPNIPHDSVPVGTGEADNQVVRVWG
jgi:seryl-tRNA synthetase